MDIPESILRYWRHHPQVHILEPEAQAFFESPAGVRYLHRQMSFFIMYCVIGSLLIEAFQNATVMPSCLRH